MDMRDLLKEVPHQGTDECGRRVVQGVIQSAAADLQRDGPAGALTDVHFVDCKLSFLRSMDYGLVNCVFENCVIKDLRCWNCRIASCSFRKCKIDDCVLSVYPNTEDRKDLCIKLQLDSCVISNSMFSRIGFKSVVLDRCRVNRCSFHKCSLFDVLLSGRFRNIELQGSPAGGSACSRCSFSGCRGSGFDTQWIGVENCTDSKDSDLRVISKGLQACIADVVRSVSLESNVQEKMAMAYFTTFSRSLLQGQDSGIVCISDLRSLGDNVVQRVLRYCDGMQ